MDEVQGSEMVELVSITNRNGEEETIRNAEEVEGKAERIRGR